MTFDAGDLVLLIDESGRKYLVTLKADGEFHFHHGIVHHRDILGAQDGLLLKSTEGKEVTVHQPTYADFALKMRRGAQIIYPKDAAQIIVSGDIYPGARVLEGGLGSGALTMALLRAVGEKGSVTSYELRDDHAAAARENISTFLGPADNLEIRLSDVREVVPEGFDRAVLDLAEPWSVVPALEAGALRSGGILSAYVPTVTQISRLAESLVRSGLWRSIRTSETFVRTWHVDPPSVRPDHKMVAHTGFLTFARLTQPSH